LKERFDNDNEDNKLNNENEELIVEEMQKTRKCYLIKIENGEKNTFNKRGNKYI